MTDQSITHIDVATFWDDPYPALKVMREETPVTFVPELGAWLITRRNDIFENEKNIDVFSSVQPDGLMTRLMGQNMMRKDGDAHQIERRAIFPTVSPKTVRDVWKSQFETATARILDGLAGQGGCDLVRDFAMPVSGDALRIMTGLTNMDVAEMDRVSQGMIDGCANYAGDPAVTENCHDCTASIDRHIDEMIAPLSANPDHSLLSVQLQAGLSDAQMRANIKLAISGGQNEPRDAIAGTVDALLNNPDQLGLVKSRQKTFLDAFQEYARWNSPIGMSPREVAQNICLHGQNIKKGQRAFLMFGSGNRDARNFENPDHFDMQQDISDAISFGAGPHFCAGAWASKTLIGDVALPMLFDRFPDIALDPEHPTVFGGWAFRGPLNTNVIW